MQILITIVELAVVWLAAFVMGFAAVKVLLPEDLERQYGALITPCVGYLVLCFVSFTVSGAFGISAANGSIVSMIALTVAAIAVASRPRWRIEPPILMLHWAKALILALPMAVVTLGPLFRFGAQTYLGAVNPDYFAGIVDNYFLLEGNHSTTTFSSSGKGTFYPIPHLAGHLTVSARFGADLFGIAIQQLLGVDTRAALTLSIGFFLLNLPLTLYFFTRVVMSFPEPPARWTAWLIGVSGPIGMSYLYFYIGQNSGLPALPLLLVAVYLLLLRPGWRTLLFCALLANALFINYFAMLPYALAPGGALALYLIYKRRLKLTHAVLLGLAFLAMAILLKFGTWRFTYASMKAWAYVIGQTLQGQYFLDFLTESFFPYFLGVYNYPSNPWLVRALEEGGARAVGVAVAFTLFAVYAIFVRRWFRETKDPASRVMVVAALAIYTAVWVRYTFLQQYGYAVFKMTSWLQFMLVPFFAYGIYTLRRGAEASPVRRRYPGAIRAGLAVACVVYVVTNVITSGLYAYNGAGRNTKNGYIVNHFGTAGNLDYHELSAALGKVVKPDQSTGLVFTDSIRQFWTAYYLRDHRLSVLSHDLIPGDDENLPDPETNTRVDYYGNVQKISNPYLHGAGDDFYLTWGRADLNPDVVDPGFAGPPRWENGSFRLYPASAAKDVLFTGHGFYRLEYFEPIASYFHPRALRWSADGGEFYLLRPSVPGGKYRIAFDAMVGYEYPSESRTLEFWRDGVKFQELFITSTARVVSEPFEADPGLTRLVVSVREKNGPLPRKLGLWNRDIPADYRRMNVAFSSVHVLAPGAPMPSAPKLNDRLPFMRWHAFAHTFNGLEPDGWIGDRGRISMAVPEGASRLVISAMAAGNLNLNYPMVLNAIVNGRQVKHTLARAGAFDLELPLAPGEKVAAVTIESPQSRLIGEESLRYKVIKRSMHLESLEFR